MGDTSPLGNQKLEELARLLGGLASDISPPRAKGRRQLGFDVKRQIAVHHAAEAGRRDGREPHALLRLCIEQ
mgnify:CR=1 FL=1